MIKMRVFRVKLYLCLEINFFRPMDSIELMKSFFVSFVAAIAVTILTVCNYLFIFYLLM